jgi:hypothetical protein
MAELAERKPTDIHFSVVVADLGEQAVACPLRLPTWLSWLCLSSALNSERLTADNTWTSQKPCFHDFTLLFPIPTLALLVI